MSSTLLSGVHILVRIRVMLVTVPITPDTSIKSPIANGFVIRSIIPENTLVRIFCKESEKARETTPRRVTMDDVFIPSDCAAIIIPIT